MTHRWDKMQRLIPISLQGEQKRHIQNHQLKMNSGHVNGNWPVSLVLCNHKKSQSACLHISILELQGQTGYLDIHLLVRYMLVEMCGWTNVLKYNRLPLSKVSHWDLCCCYNNAAALFLTKYFSISVKNQLLISLDLLTYFMSVNIKGQESFHTTANQELMTITLDFWRYIYEKIPALFNF